MQFAVSYREFDTKTLNTFGINGRFLGTEHSVAVAGTGGAVLAIARITAPFVLAFAKEEGSALEPTVHSRMKMTQFCNSYGNRVHPIFLCNFHQSFLNVLYTALDW